MTIIIGAIDKGVAYVGADSLWSWGSNFVREMKTPKFLSVPDDSVIIAGAGEERLSQVFTELVNAKETQYLLDINGKDDVITMAKMLHNEVVDAGIGSPRENEMPDHNMGFLVVKAGIPKLFVIDSDYSVTEFDDHISLGCGGEMGESAMKALDRAGIRGKEAVLNAIQTVCELHPFCGGKIDLRKLSVESSEH